MLRAVATQAAIAAAVRANERTVRRILNGELKTTIIRVNEDSSLGQWEDAVQEHRHRRTSKIHQLPAELIAELLELRRGGGTYRWLHGWLMRQGHEIRLAAIHKFISENR